MSLTRDQILNARDFNIKEVDVPEWGGSVYVRTVDCILSEKIEDLREGGGSAAMRAATMAYAICDEDGNSIFENEDIEKLYKKSAKAADRILIAFMELNNIKQEEVDEEVKN
jgi:hypothetical protein